MQDLPGFFFAGAGTLPAFLFLAGAPALAILVMLPLLLAACVVGLADPQAPLRTMPAPGDTPHQDGPR